MDVNVINTTVIDDEIEQQNEICSTYVHTVLKISFVFIYFFGQ